MLVKTAQGKGFAVHAHDDARNWSNVHVEDLADQYLLALERAKAGSIFFAEDGLPPTT